MGLGAGTLVGLRSHLLPDHPEDRGYFGCRSAEDEDME